MFIQNVENKTKKLNNKIITVVRGEKKKKEKIISKWEIN